MLTSNIGSRVSFVNYMIMCMAKLGRILRKYVDFAYMWNGRTIKHIRLMLTWDFKKPFIRCMRSIFLRSIVLLPLQLHE